ncbi:cellulase family glycosylhydrolase [Legionella spiritensis]|uniref:Endoglucanase n=1 Tax=Legionella spiritensis TaxID=452 RepID=A0A0W0Z588_LEGSP|nr:cellulase family glycosylhydrolase [Legionella spiritensis]KTD64320.1 Endoglucanase precursor [Legionella spiritensis]SNV46619.1 Endoglucanase precursor [Legionella spiritensis]
MIMNYIPVAFSLLPALTFAATMSNHITGVGPNGNIKPYICIQNQAGTVALPLAPGDSGDANKASGNAYYAGAALRFNGCDMNNPYLGYVGFNISSTGNNAINKYTPPEGIHISYENPAINSKGKVTGAIEYTPIAVNPDFKTASPARYWQFAGINLSGLEFGKVIDPVVIPNLSQKDSETPYSDLDATQSFINAGMNTVRVPVSWGYLQLDGAGKGSLNLAYYNSYIRPLLQTLTQAKTHTIIDLHAYMRYSRFGEQYSGCGPDGGTCPDGTLILDENTYQAVWGQLADVIQKDQSINKDYILFDLVNEPVEVPDDKVFTIQASLIKMLRRQGFDGYILVEGNSWTGLHSWTTHEWTGKDGQMYSNARLFTRDNFNKAGITDLNRILINVHQYLDSDYSGTHDDCLQDLSTTGPDGFNLQAFVNYLADNQLQAIVTEFGSGKNATSCSAPLQQFMQYLQDNSSKGKNFGFAGWTIWSTGHGWGGYNLRVTPDSYHMNVLGNYL